MVRVIEEQQRSHLITCFPVCMSIVVIILGAPGTLISTGALTGWIDFVIARYGWQVAKP
jgi:hypothetical protein